MPQFIVLATDYTDSEALSRRMSVRPQHLERMRIEKEKGNFEVGGAKLNEEGKMYGSMLVMNAPDEQAAWEWIQQDPYVTGKVWEKIEVLPFKIANV